MPTVRQGITKFLIKSFSFQQHQKNNTLPISFACTPDNFSKRLYLLVELAYLKMQKFIFVGGT